MNIKDIMERIPHRYPFLLVDRVLELYPGKKGIAIKNVSINEPFFQGHFPGEPIMPGVLIVEALAQLGAIIMLSDEKFEGKLAYFTGIDNMRFRKQVKPGDQLTLETEIVRMKGLIGKGKVTATVDGEVAAQGDVMFALSR